MDRYDAMRVFARIVERRSFTRAAEDLGLPRSSVTDAVKELEARLGVRLLRRTTRRVSPTLDGEAYYQRCLRLVADLEDAESAFAGAKPRGLLHVNVHPTLASHFVVPHLPGFLSEYPDIELLLSEGDRYVDLVQDGVDCALRVGTLADSDLVARRLTTLEEVTCASPSYIARHGIPRDIDALDGHRMVGFRSSATGAVLPLEFTSSGDGAHRHAALERHRERRGNLRIGGARGIGADPGAPLPAGAGFPPRGARARAHGNPADAHAGLGTLPTRQAPLSAAAGVPRLAVRAVPGRNGGWLSRVLPGRSGRHGTPPTP